MASSEPLDKDMMHRLAHSVRRHGERRVTEAIGVNRQTVCRALAGLGIYAGSRAIIERELPAIEELQVTPRAPKGRP